MLSETVQRWLALDWFTSEMGSANNKSTQATGRAKDQLLAAVAPKVNGHIAPSNSHSSLLAPMKHHTEEKINNVPIAVIGMSFRFPRGLESAESFWEALSEGRSAWSSFPESRLHFDGVYDPDEERLNGFPVKGAHFVDGDVAAFDAPFFTIGPGEAAEIDPQSRILLETTYHALENAGIPMERVFNSKTSVHTGSFGDDYKAFSTRDPQFGGQYSASSVSPNMLANRISWFFNLRGESINMDTACSSTLIAFHTACQGLRDGNAEMAIVAGANLFLSPDMAMSLNNQGFISPDGRCWSFDEKANGYGRGEGFGALILKRVDEALINNDSIRAVVRATGTNQDGRTPGIVQPSRQAQAELIRETHQKAGLDMHLTRYVEAHGTGTPVGDPIEAGAIADAFEHCISPVFPLYVGSVKSNIGHLEGTSGIAGLIKCVLMLEQGMIPGIAGLEGVNATIAKRHPDLLFPPRLCHWPSEGLRRLSINSFGFGGSNAHVIMEDAQNHLKLAGISEYQENHLFASANSYPQMLIFSAQDEKGIGRLALTYSQHFAALEQSINDDYMSRLVYTLNERRSVLLWRSFAICYTSGQLADGIKTSRPVRALSNPRLALCFTGQGGQWATMGDELRQFEIYNQSISDASVILKSMGCPWNLEEELSRDEKNTRIDEPEFSQTLTTVVQIALVDLMESMDLHSTVVVGHSSGEIAAAYSIGALDQRSAISIAYYRGLLSSRLANSSVKVGAMMSVNLSKDEIEPYFEALQAQHGHLGISIGCVNSPGNVTITGDAPQINILKEVLDQIGVFARKVAVPVAYHSTHMHAVARDYLKAIGKLSSRRRALADIMISSVTGEAVTSEQLVRKEYWVQNMVSPVLFSSALMAAVSLKVQKNGNSVRETTRLQIEDILEVGPHSALQRAIKETLNAISQNAGIGYKSVLIRNVNAVQSLFDALGYLYCRGHQVNMRAVNRLNMPTSPLPTLLNNLPKYPFDHSRSYWRESRVSKGHRFRGAPRNDFLGMRVPDWNPHEAKWRKRIKLSEEPWIGDHTIARVNILPGAAMLVMAIEAAKDVSRSQKSHEIVGYTLRDVSFSRALAISQDPDGTEVEFYLRSSGQSADRVNSWSEFSLYCIENDTWVEACRGRIQVSHVDEGLVDQGRQAQLERERHAAELSRIRSSCPRTVNMGRIYKLLSEKGICFGPAHQAIKSCAYNDNMECFGEVNPHQWRVKARKFDQTDFTVHPTFLDGLFQMGLVAMTEGGTSISPSVVAGIRHLWIAEGGISAFQGQTHSPHMMVWNKSTFLGLGNTSSNVVALDPTGQRSVVVVDGLDGKFLTEKEDRGKTRRLCWNFDYRPDIEMLNKAELLTQVTTGFPLQQAPRELDHDVKLLLYLCILRTLKYLTIEDRDKLAPHHRKYLVWMEREKEKLYSNSPATRGIEFRAVLDDEQFYNNMIDRLEGTNCRGKFFAVLARNLFEILTGKKDALQVMFQTPLVKNYYQELYKATNGLSKALSFIDIYAHKHPDMKILEIGAGTGSMTRYVLDTLTQNGSREAGAGTPRFSHYTYTDISAGFFSDAASLFAEFSDKVTFSVLNIENDPVKQGFGESAYDLIIADNVFHATQNLETTLRNARKLLKPGGRLALFELTDPENVRTNFAFGLLPGWWRYQDRYRTFSAGVSDAVWDELLRYTGFSGIDLDLQDYDDPVCHEHSALITTATLEAEEISHPFPRTLIVLDPKSEIQNVVAKQVAEYLQNAGIPETMSLSLEGAAQIPNLKEWFCIMILDLQETSILAKMNPAEYQQIKILLRADGGILWVNIGGGIRPERPEHALVQGAFRGLRMEERHSKFISLSLDVTHLGDARHAANRINQVFKTVATRPVNDCEQEYVERNGHLCVDRFIEANYINQSLSRLMADTQPGECRFSDHPALLLTIASPGLIDSLEFIEDETAKVDLAPEEIEIEVEASGVNFRDCLIALGRLPGNSFGFECAGTVSRKGRDVQNLEIGDRVCASALGTYQTYTRCNATDAILLPDSMSFVTGAALPVVFTTAFYALTRVANIQKGESILIHSAAGGTGQAAIQVAQMRGAEIFVTVGSPEKRALLMETYYIAEDHIFDSRNTSFVNGILGAKNGGVDVILNSLSGDFLTESWRCIAPFGRFLELGKKDILSNSSLPMLPFAKNASFHAIDLNEARKYQPRILEQLRNDISTLLAEGRISPPQPIHLFGVGEIEQAFRYLQSGKNTGKTVVEMRRHDSIKTNLKVKRTWDFDAHSSYVIAGGLGGIGRSTARWMAQRGAKYLIFLSRSGVSNDEGRDLVDSLYKQGVTVEAPRCDIADFDKLKHTLNSLESRMPPIKGCIQSAMVLRNKVFENMVYQDWTDTFACKVPGTWNLHQLLPSGMDFFITYSSIAGGVGGTASFNYSAACAYQDALMHYRNAQGEKAITFNLGVMVDDGVLRDNDTVRTALIGTGYLLGITQREMFALLEYHCDPALPVHDTPLRSQVLVGLDVPSSIKARGAEIPIIMTRPLFRGVWNITDTNETVHEDVMADVVKDLLGVRSKEEAGVVIAQSLMQRLSKALGVPLENLDPSKPMHAYGVDSLVAVELRNWFKWKLEAEVAVFELLGNATFDDIGTLVAGKSNLVTAMLRESGPSIS